MCNSKEEDFGHFVPSVISQTRSRGKITPKPKILNFTVKKGDHESKPNDFLFKPKGLILIVTVTSGIFHEGDEVILQSTVLNDRSLSAKISEIQKNHQKVPLATQGEKVGICLPGITSSDLRRIRRTNKTRTTL